MNCIENVKNEIKRNGKRRVYSIGLDWNQSVHKQSMDEMALEKLGLIELHLQLMGFERFLSTVTNRFNLNTFTHTNTLPKYEFCNTSASYVPCLFRFPLIYALCYLSSFDSYMNSRVFFLFPFFFSSSLHSMITIVCFFSAAVPFWTISLLGKWMGFGTLLLLMLLLLLVVNF